MRRSAFGLINQPNKFSWRGAMNINKVEIEAVQEAAVEISSEVVLRLTEFQLNLVGGGCGEVLFG
jgi:hypothetical protein